MLMLNEEYLTMIFNMILLQQNTLAPLYLHWLSLILAWICNYIYHKVGDEITYPFPNFNWYII